MYNKLLRSKAEYLSALNTGDAVARVEWDSDQFIHAVIKTIKFREKPKPEELNKQLNLVLNQFDSIFTSSKNLTVRVEKKRKKDDY